MAKPNKPDETSYLWENIPKTLWGQAQAKAASTNPKKPIKWILRELLEKWVSEGGPFEPIQPAERRPRAVAAVQPEEPLW